MADGRVWPALVVRAAVTDPVSDERVAALVDGFAPIAIEELTPLPLPPGGLWDPTFPPPPDPPPAPLHWRVFFDTVADRDRAATTLQMEHPTLELTPEDVADEDWAARSQRSLTAVTAGLFVVAPPWDIPAVSDRQTLLVIEPSRGFGTGHHQSTRLCLRALSDVDLHGTRVLDLGTGSGVLALAASLRGAAHVLALDVDDDAIESARESHRLNPAASGIEWLVADFRHAGHAQIDRVWDVVVANLTGGMLRSSAERLRELVRPGGLLIVSGFDEEERADVQAALRMDECAALSEDAWVGLVLRQPASEPR